MKLREVLVVGVTKMRSAACVGAFDVHTGESLRLTRGGFPHFEPLDTELRPGDVLQIEYLGKPWCPKPHTEDIWVGNWSVIAKVAPNDVAAFVLNEGKAPVWRGKYSALFDGLLEMTDKQKLVLRRSTPPPAYSTGFWIPDEHLFRTLICSPSHTAVALGVVSSQLSTWESNTYRMESFDPDRCCAYRSRAGGTDTQSSRSHAGCSCQE
jgi:hypothetical protein